VIGKWGRGAVSWGAGRSKRKGGEGVESDMLVEERKGSVNDLKMGRGNRRWRERKAYFFDQKRLSQALEKKKSRDLRIFRDTRRGAENSMKAAGGKKSFKNTLLGRVNGRRLQDKGKPKGREVIAWEVKSWSEKAIENG